MLSSESSAEHGQWRTARVPFMKEIMDAQSPTHPCTESGLLKGTQIAGTETMLNVIGYYVDKTPCPILLVQPTTEMIKLTSKQRVQPMFEETLVLREKVRSARSRDSGNTVLSKKFRGGLLRMTTASSGPALRSMPVRVLQLDEIDAYPVDVAGEGDPVAVAIKRTDTFGSRKKIFVASSPKIKGSSRIDRYYEAGTRAKYHVPCPHCAHEQVLRWAQMRWAMVQTRELTCRDCGGVSVIHDDSALVCAHCQASGQLEQLKLTDTDDVERAWYECEACGQAIEEGKHKTGMLARGRHIHEVPGPGHFLADDDPHPWAIWVRAGAAVRRFLPTFQRPLTWRVSGLYSPHGWFSWRDAVRAFLEANKGGYDDESGESLLQVFYNTVLGEAFEIEGEQADANVLSLRAEPYEPATVPAGGLMLVAFVDVQGNRLEYQCKAYGRGEESWLVDYQVLAGDPSNSADKVWTDLINLRNRAYTHASGNPVYVAAMGIDSGYLTQVVYDFCRKWQHRHVFATKGDAGQGKTVLGPPKKVDFSHNGKAIKHGATVRILGVDTVKELVFQRLPIAVPGPGCMHFPRGLPTDYYDGLTSEKKIPRRKKGQVVYEYVKTRERNEPLDLEVGCYATFVYAGGKRVNWEQLERVINPLQKDIFAAPEPKAADAGAAEAPSAAATDAAATEKPQRPARHPRPTRLPRRDPWRGW